MEETKKAKKVISSLFSVNHAGSLKGSLLQENICFILIALITVVGVTEVISDISGLLLLV